MQVDDELGVKLHDRATRDLPLSAEEEIQLQAWYYVKDQEEAAMLRANSPWYAAADQAPTHIEETLEMIETLIKRIREVETENQSLRQEIARLCRQSSQQPNSKAA